MFTKKENILMLDDRRADRSGGFGDPIAVATALMVAGLGIFQLFMPAFVQPLTGFEAGMATQVIGLQWIVLGVLLAAGGLFRTRVLTIFASEYLLLVGLIGVGASLLHRGDAVPLMVHGAIAFTGFFNAGIARLTDKADLKRELRIARETAKQANENFKSTPSGSEVQHG